MEKIRSRAKPIAGSRVDLDYNAHHPTFFSDDLADFISHLDAEKCIKILNAVKDVRCISTMLAKGMTASMIAKYVGDTDTWLTNRRAKDFLSPIGSIWRTHCEKVSIRDLIASSTTPNKTPEKGEPFTLRWRNGAEAELRTGGKVNVYDPVMALAIIVSYGCIYPYSSSYIVSYRLAYLIYCAKYHAPGWIGLRGDTLSDENLDEVYHFCHEISPTSAEVPKPVPVADAREAVQTPSEQVASVAEAKAPEMHILPPTEPKEPEPVRKPVVKLRRTKPVDKGRKIEVNLCIHVNSLAEMTALLAKFEEGSLASFSSKMLA